MISRFLNLHLSLSTSTLHTFVLYCFPTGLPIGNLLLFHSLFLRYAIFLFQFLFLHIPIVFLAVLYFLGDVIASFYLKLRLNLINFNDNVSVLHVDAKFIKISNVPVRSACKLLLSFTMCRVWGSVLLLLIIGINRNYWYSCN